MRPERGATVHLLTCLGAIIAMLSSGDAPAQATVIQPRPCTSPVHGDTTVGTSAATVPATQTSGRRFVTLCNSNENTGAPTVKCRIDGTAPVTGLGNAGDVLAVGQCVSYNIASTVSPQCIASAAATHVTSLECK